MNQPILRHIRKIEYCAAYHLKRAIILPAQAIALVREPMPWQELPLVGLASLEVTDEVENGVRITSAKLSATLACTIHLPTVPLAFRITDVRGKTYLLGTSAAPHPLLTIPIQVAENPKDATNHSILISFKNATSVIQLIM